MLGTVTSEYWMWWNRLQLEGAELGEELVDVPCRGSGDSPQHKDTRSPCTPTTATMEFHSNGAQHQYFN